MTREDILRQMAALQTQLDELDKAQGLAYVSTALTEADARLLLHRPGRYAL